MIRTPAATNADFFFSFSFTDIFPTDGQSGMY